MTAGSDSASGLRVLHVGKFYAPQRGGIERHVQDLAEWQVAHGIDARVLVHQPAGRWRGVRARVGDVEVTRAGCIAAPLYAPISPGFPLQLAAALQRQQPQVLHLHLPNPSCFALLASPAARRIPWLIHWHADISPDAKDPRLHLAYRLYRPFEQAVLARAAAIVATSQPYLDASTALAPWRAKAHVVPLGLRPAPDGTAAGIDWPAGDGLRLLAVGRLSYYKGFDVLLDAMALLRDRLRGGLPRLLLVGDGEHAGRLREHAGRLALHDLIRFTGAVDDMALLAAYASADAFVLPSLDRSEAFGLVLLEAMRAGLPVIASRIAGSGVIDVVADGVNGELVPPGDAAALADVLARWSGDRERLAALGIAGHQRWRSRFTLEASAEDIASIYRRLAG